MRNKIILGLVLVLLSSFVSAALVTDNSGLTLTEGPHVGGGESGVVVQMKSDRILINVTFSANTVSLNNCSIRLDPSNTLVHTTSIIVSNVCVFNESVAIINNSIRYRVVGDTTGGSMFHDSTPGYPIIGTALNYINGTQTGLDFSGFGWGVESILTDSLPIIAFDLTLNNIFNSSSINIFAAQIINSTDSFNLTTTNGTINYPLNQTINITIFNITGSEGVYFNQTRDGVNTSTDLIIDTWQSVLVVNAKEKITNLSLGVFNVTVTSIEGTQTNNSNSSKNTTFLLNSGFYNITGSAENFSFVENSNFTTLSLTQSTTDLFFSSNQLNITAKEFFFNTTVTNFTITVRLNGSFLENLTTTSGFVLFNAPNGTYNLTITSGNFATDSSLINLLNTTQNHTFFLFQTNSVLFSIFDEVLLTPINFTTVTVELISDVFAANFTTNNGSLFLSLLTPSTYTVRTSAIDFSTRFFEFAIIDTTTTNVNLYLVNESITGFKEITASVVDENNAIVENALIKLLRFDLSLNSFTVREIIRSNFEGEAFMDVVQNEEFYKFQVFFDDELKLTTEKSIITRDEITLQISFGQVIAQSFFDMRSANGTVIFNNVTNEFIFSFSDPLSTITQGCLEVFRFSSIEETSLNQTCVAGSAGMITLTFPIKNDTSFKGVGTVFIGSTEKFADMAIHTFRTVVDMGSMGWLVAFLATMLFVGYGVFNPVVGAALTPVPLLFITLFGIVNFEWQYAAGFEIVGIIVAYIVSRG